LKAEIGRICFKMAGREAGQKCVIVSVIDKNFVVVTGPKSLTGVRRRRVNVSHLAFTPYKLNIKENASDEEILKTIQESGLVDFMKEEAKVKFE
jgi:large subunit ribosomal protein L14e